MRYTTIAIAIILAALTNAQWTHVNLHPAGATWSNVFAVGDGQQVGYVRMPFNDHASVWSGTAASWTDLNPPGAETSYAFGVNGGRQVGRVGLRAGFWTGSPGSWTQLHPPGAFNSQANDSHGNQQVGWAFLTTQTAGMWSGSPGTWVNLHPAGYDASSANGIHDSQQSGGAVIAGATHAGYWQGTSSSWVDLHPAGAEESYAVDVYAGQQAGIADVGANFHASVWHGSPGSWVDINPAGAVASFAVGVHAGQQAGYANVDGVDHASLWLSTAGSWVDLNAFLPADFSWARATGIWHDANRTYVVGNGYNTVTLREEALMWVAQHVAPTSFSMFRGTVFSGDLASLINSDGNKLVLRPGITLGTSQPPIQIILDATAPTASPDGFSFSLESSASFGNAEQKISLWNYSTGAYELLDTRLATLTDDVAHVTVRTNQSRFIEPGTLAIRALVSFRAVGPSLAFPWSGRIDKVWWSFPG